MIFPPDQFVNLPDNRWNPRGDYPVNVIILHSTRGGSNSAMEIQDEAAANWFKSPNSLAADGSWGASASAVIGHEGKVTWFMADDKYPSWSAGWVDVVGISFELAQNDVNTPFTSATLERIAIEAARLCHKYNLPTIRIPYLANADAGKVKGIIGHEDTEQGRIAHKTDPGPQFPWAWFLARVKNILAMEVKAMVIIPEGWQIGGATPLEGAGRQRKYNEQRPDGIHYVEHWKNPDGGDFWLASPPLEGIALRDEKIWRYAQFVETVDVARAKLVNL